MDDERRNLLARKEIISGYLAAVEHPGELLRVCANVAGDSAEAVKTVADAFGVGEIVARAILDLQVRRFTPHEIGRMKDELADYDRRLREISPTGS